MIEGGTQVQFETEVLPILRTRRRRGPWLRIALVMPPDPGVRAQLESLRRALSLLGHYVFVLSVSRHRDLVSKVAQPGATSWQLNLTVLDRALETFDPDMVLVSNANYRIGKRTREWAAQKGVVLTYFAPPTVARSASLPEGYDVIAGSVGADAGGIELPFVVGADASLIFALGCRGHVPMSFALVGERDFAESMPELAEALKTHPLFRSIGTGDSTAEVTGQEHLAGALVHVFPPSTTSQQKTLWRCIISLLSGSVVVVPRTLRFPDELSALPGVFVYSRESELKGILTGLESREAELRVAASEAAGIIRRCAMYEDQIPSLFESIRKLAEDPAAFSAPTRQRVAERWAPTTETRAPIAAVAGWYGERNIGDELILDVLAQSLKRVNPKGQVIVMAPRPSRVEVDHGLPALPRHEMKSVAQAAQYADCLIVGGGGIWNDKAVERNGGLAGLFQNPKYSVANLATLPVTFHAVGKPVAGLGLGVGPLRERSGRSLVRLMASLSSVLSVRDSNSQTLLQNLGHAGSAATQDGDLAFAWEAMGATAKLGRLKKCTAPLRLAINVRPLDNGDTAGAVRLWPALAECLVRLGEEFGCSFVGIPFQEADEAELHGLLDPLEDIECTVLPFDSDPAQVVADLKDIDLLVSMRLHASILAHRVGIPAVGLSYESKISDYFHQIGESARLLGPLASADEVSDVVAATLIRRTEVRERLLPVVAALEKRARLRLDDNIRSLLALTRDQTDFWPLTAAETW